MKIRKSHLPFILILIIAVLVRLVIIFTKYHSINSDNGILGLMAKHILKGEFPAFFYGQPYMGSLEAFIIAFFFIILGISVNSMLLAMTFITTVGIISAYFLGKELWDKRLGLYAMVIACIPPAYFFWHGLSAFGGYPETFLFGNIMLTLTLIAVKENNKILKIKYYTWLGLTAGIAFWTHLLALYYIVPAMIFIFVNENKKLLFLKAVPFATPAFILGSAPLWIYNLRHHFETFKFPAEQKNIFAGAKYFFNTVPFFISNEQFRYKYLYYIISFIYIFSFLYLVMKQEKTKKSTTSKFIIFLLFISIFYFFSTSHFAYLLCPRYIIPLFTVIMISTAYLCRWLDLKFRYLGIIPLSLVILFNGINISESYILDKEESARDRKIFQDLITFLEKNKLHTNYCPFTISQKLNFLSGENIVNAVFGDEKYPPYEKIVEESDNAAIINTNRLLEPMLDMLCKSYKKARIDDFYIYYDFEPRGYGRLLSPKEWRSISSYNQGDAQFAYDKNIDRYWCTIKTKSRGMYFKLDLGRRYKICRVAVLNANHWRNYWGEILIEVSPDGKKWTRINMPRKPEPLFFSGPRLYWHLLDGRFEFAAEPVECRYIKIFQCGRDRSNPWEINEIFVWEYAGERTIDSSEAQEIYDFLQGKNIKNVYADFWLSAKINAFSDGKINTIQPMNHRYPERGGLSRFIQPKKDTAFIIDNENTGEFEELAGLYNLKIAKKTFKDYVCFLIEENHGISDIFFWSGYGLLKTNRLSNNKEILLKKDAIFKGGFRFLGYSYKKDGGLFTMDYFWQTKMVPKDIFAFVYFMQDNKIIFQNDHPLLEQFPLTETPEKNEIFRETYIFKNPPHGRYDIYIGLCLPKKNQERLKTVYPIPNKSKIYLGQIEI